MEIASARFSDDEFLEAFHACRLGSDQFHHADHLRLAWLHTRREPVETAVRNVCDGIQKFSIHHGVPELYNQTITTAWVRLVATHDEPTFEDFLAKNAEVLDKDLLYRFWSPEVLRSDAARTGWVPPDVRQMPV